MAFIKSPNSLKNLYLRGDINSIQIRESLEEFSTNHVAHSRTDDGHGIEDTCKVHIDGLVQERRNSSLLAIHLSTSSTLDVDTSSLVINSLRPSEAIW